MDDRPGRFTTLSTTRGTGVRFDDAVQELPVVVELLVDGEVRDVRRGYDEVEQVPDGVSGRCLVPLSGTCALDVRDRWRAGGDVVRLERTAAVVGTMAGGFATAATLRLPYAWPEVDAFAPGVLHGRGAPVAVGSLGSADVVRLREDRLPAPLFAVALPDGTSLAVLHLDPDGATTREDSYDTSAAALVDGRFAFASLGGQSDADGLEVGLWFPGSEGSQTYSVATPLVEGQFRPSLLEQWRRRGHPLEDGVVHRYRVAFRSGVATPTQLWRWAWEELSPRVDPAPLALVREQLAARLAAAVRTVDGRTGPVHAMSPLDGRVLDDDVLLGFTARAADTGTLLLQEPGLEATGRAVVDTLVRLPVSPPLGEGFSLRTGEVTSGPRPDFYLRSLAEGGWAVLRAWRSELAAGRPHEHWRAWCQALGAWLLDQELPDGGLPRAWRTGTAELVDADARGSVAAVPFLVSLAADTGDARCLDVAVRAGEATWRLGGAVGHFAGGTLDHLGALDKEGATLALEAFLDLHDATGDDRWLQRARGAGDAAERWIYLWDVPMPVDEDPSALHWDPTASTVGAQLIGTGHSGVDMYMAVDVRSYLRLAARTGDDHYRDVSRLLLHGTKSMLGTTGGGRPFAGPGWQQEHWSLAPPRGVGRSQLWLPWVATSQLRSIVDVEQLDPALLPLP